MSSSPQENQRQRVVCCHLCGTTDEKFLKISDNHNPLRGTYCITCKAAIRKGRRNTTWWDDFYKWHSIYGFLICENKNLSDPTNDHICEEEKDGMTCYSMFWFFEKMNNSFPINGEQHVESK